MEIARNFLAYAKRRASVDYQQSIVRRTAMLCALVVPAFGANFLVYYFSARLLAPDDFGIFYVAVTVGNVLYSGSNVVNVFLTRQLVHVGEADGPDAIVSATLWIERRVIIIGAACSASFFLVLLIATKQIGLPSPLIIMLVVLDTYTAYVTDIGRILLQSLRRTMALGFYTFAWMFLRFALCIGGILLFGTVWGALSGIVLSAIGIFMAFHFWIRRISRDRLQSCAVPLPILSLLPATLGYGLMVLVSNLDVIFSYLILGETDLGIYSGSSVFPKAALVVITPLLQMLIPMMITGRRIKGRIGIVAKINGVIFAMTAAGSLMVWVLSDQLCGSRWGLQLCEPPVLDTLLLTVVPLALLRTLVVLEYAWGREMLMLWLAIPAVAFGVVAWLFPPTLSGLANGYAGFSMTAFLFFALVCLIAELLIKRSTYQPS
jgi:O-antigen/teichoic acid export membrane protein